MGYESSLPARVSTVHPQIRTRHVRTCRTEEEYCGASEVFGLAELVEHILSWPVHAPLGIEAEELFNHCGDDITGRYRIHADPVLAPFGRQILGQLEDASF